MASLSDKIKKWRLRMLIIFWVAIPLVLLVAYLAIYGARLPGEIETGSPTAGVESPDAGPVATRKAGEKP